MRSRLAAAVLFALCGGAGAQETDGESWREAEVVRPPYPASGNLIEFYVGPTATARFRIDASTLSVGDDGVIRFVLVVDAPGGATNVSFEGMRCQARSRRVYAYGRNDRTWSPLKEARWLPVRSAGPNSPYASLMKDYFCPDGLPVRDAAQAKRALSRKGAAMEQ